MILKPKLLFLDEPTVGLDIQARRGLWNASDEYKEKIKELFLDTEERIEEITDR